MEVDAFPGEGDRKGHGWSDGGLPVGTRASGVSAAVGKRQLPIRSLAGELIERAEIKMSREYGSGYRRG